MRTNARRPAFPRAAILLVALLSAVLLGGVQSASCEMHGLGAARSDGVEQAAMSGHAHEGSTASPLSDDHDHAAGEGGCDCSCIGDCRMVAPLATAPAAATIRVALVAPEPSRQIDAEPTRAPPPTPDRLLPFANGPPVSALL